MMPEDMVGQPGGDAHASVRMSFPRRLDALEKVFAMSCDFCAANAIEDERARTTDFVLEEIFTNLVKYNPRGGGEIEIDLSRRDQLLSISVTDFDADRFDIREAAAVDIDRPLDERTPGGLGLHLIRKFADRIDYEYVGRRSSVTIYLSLG